MFTTLYQYFYMLCLFYSSQLTSTEIVSLKCPETNILPSNITLNKNRRACHTYRRLIWHTYMPIMLQDCGDDPGWSYFNESCYFVGVTSKSWDDSELFCEQESAHLATVRSMDEHAFVIDILNTTLRTAFDLPTLSTSFVWLGAHSIFNPGVFSWINGEPWDFINWDSMQPNSELDQCMAMYPLADIAGLPTLSSGMWYNRHCQDLNVFVCERSVWPLVCYEDEEKNKLEHSNYQRTFTLLISNVQGYNLIYWYGWW